MRGLDIGCGANLIYPLLGAAVNGWRFVAVDVTTVAVRCARRILAANPHLAPLIDIRLVVDGREDPDPEHVDPDAEHAEPGSNSGLSRKVSQGPDTASAASAQKATPSGKDQQRSPVSTAVIITPAIRPGESFAFTICNPPFFESSVDAGLNPSTAHGGETQPNPRSVSP